MTIRTRMAPSPTGEYHIGHIRTVLYNYALAKKSGGRFILRIEDTDRERLVENAVDRILDVIKAYDLSWDEGPRVGGPYEPYVQSQRLEIYKEYSQELIKNGHAYYCFCTTERLEKLREKQRSEGLPVTKYDRHCLTLSQSEIDTQINKGMPYVVRLKVPAHDIITFHDEVLGDITVNSEDIDDQVLLKSDGFPTYQLAVVIDDHLMNITHVMRGCDWIPSTPKHVLLYKAFGWEMPKHIHLPNLKELGGNKKLSKRFGSVAATEFLQEGYLPEAVLNFLMFLGWNPGTDREIYTLEEFVQDFSVERIQKTDLVAFDREKLLWFNGYYLRRLPGDSFIKVLKDWSSNYSSEPLIAGFSDNVEYTLKVVGLIQDRVKKLDEFNHLAAYFYAHPKVNTDELTGYTGDLSRAKNILNDFHDLYKSVNNGDWETLYLDKSSHSMIEEKGYAPKEAFMTLRIALTGEKATPPIFDVAGLLGKANVLDRITNAISML